MRPVVVAVLLLALAACGRQPAEGAPEPGAAQAAAPKPQPPAPVALQQRLDDLAETFPGEVGIAVMDVDAGWIAAHRGEDLFPQQSVSKTWVAITLLDKVDRGELGLNDQVVIRREDMSVFHQPISQQIGDFGYVTTLEDLLRRAMTDSDNTANDKIMRTVGGVEAVRETLAAKNLAGVKIFGEERYLQSRIAGLEWDPAWAGNASFKLLRARMPRDRRDAAVKAYLADPVDGATPVGVARALARLHQGELLSDASTARLLGMMADSVNGRRRLKGGLPAGWRLAHKTGTGQDWSGGTVGINDVGLITAPDGKTYAIAVFIGQTREPTPRRLEFMQAVARAVVAHHQSEQAAAPS